MAYRQSNPLVKLAILAVLVWAGWKYGLPWVQKQGFVSGSKQAAAGSPSADCVTAADQAVGAWSRGVVRFMNPPIDRGAWDGFRSEVRSGINRAESSCSCGTEACAKAKEVMRDLDRLLSDMDAAARSGGAPSSDLVRAQESIDLKLEEAWKLADAGK